jgi:hypothetical protein
MFLYSSAFKHFEYYNCTYSVSKAFMVIYKLLVSFKVLFD